MIIDRSKLSDQPTVSEVMDLLSEYGSVQSFKITSDLSTGQSKLSGIIYTESQKIPPQKDKKISHL